MRSDLKKEIAMRNEPFADQKRELRLQSRVIEKQKEMIEFLQKHISKITDIMMDVTEYHAHVFLYNPLLFLLHSSAASPILVNIIKYLDREYNSYLFIFSPAK